MKDLEALTEEFAEAQLKVTHQWINQGPEQMSLRLNSAIGGMIDTVSRLIVAGIHQQNKDPEYMKSATTDDDGAPVAETTREMQIEQVQLDDALHRVVRVFIDQRT